MSNLTILGDTSGSVVLQAPAVAGSTTLTLPATTGTVLASGSTGVCVAWVNFNGATATIRAGYNVSSITRNGTGDYTINFTNALADANYAFGGYCTIPSSRALIFTDNPITYSAGSLRLSTGYVNDFTGSTAKADATFVNVIVFR